MKVAIFGDMHGHVEPARRAMEWANQQGVGHAIWAGDCGLWPGIDGIVSLDLINAAAEEFQITNFWVGGNHEWWPEWIRLVRSKDVPKDMWGFSVVRTNIRLAPRVHTWKMGGKWFGALAGAASIDRRWRVTGKSWWPEETITEDEIASVEKMNTDKFHVSYFITHDAASNTPFGFHLYDDASSFDCRLKIDRAIRHLHPDMHFHGHYHKFYHWMNGMTETWGLNMESDDYAMGILDTVENTFTVRQPFKASLD